MKKWLLIYGMWFVAVGVICGQTITVVWPDRSSMPARIGDQGRMEAGAYVATQGQEKSTRIRQWNADAAVRLLQTGYDHLAIGLNIRQEQVSTLFRSQQVAAGIAYRRELNEPRADFRNIVGAGVQLGLYHLNLDAGDWIFSSQFNDQLYQFDPAINSNEQLSGVNWSSNVQPVVHAGLYYRLMTGPWTMLLVPSFATLNTPSLDMDGWSYVLPSQMQLLGQLEYRDTEQVTLGAEGWYTRLEKLSDLQLQGYIRIGKQDREETTFQLGGILGVNRDPNEVQFMHGGLQARIRWKDHLAGLRVEDALSRVNRWGTRLLIQYRYVLRDE